MSEGLIAIIVALISAIGGLIGYCITIWGIKKMELEKMDRDDINARREFLALTIKDETQSLGVRRAAAREYLEKGYNGVIKQFIYENALDK